MMDMKTQLKKGVKFAKENKVMMCQLAAMGFVVLTSDTTFASTTSGSASFSGVTGPLNTLKDTVKGPIATGTATIGVVGLGLATASGMENQVLKRAIQFVGGTATGLGAAGIISDIGTASGLLF